MTAVLAAHLGDDALEVALALGAPRRRCAMISRPTAPEPVKAIVWTRGSRDERGADVALARQQRERVGRHAPPRAAPRDEHRRAARRLLGGLEDDGVAGGERRGGHPERDREREVPRRDDRDDAARRVAQLVALARHLEQRRGPARARPPRARSTRGSRSPRRRRRRPPPTAWPPRGRRARPSSSRRSRRIAAAARERGARARRRLRDRPRRASRPRRRVRRRLGRLGRARRRARAARVGGDELARPRAGRRRSHRHAQRQLGVERVQRVGEPARARARGAARASARCGTASWTVQGRGQQLLEVAPRACSARKDSLAVFSSSRRTR